MSYNLSTNTRKIAVYGRRNNTRVVNNASILLDKENNENRRPNQTSTLFLKPRVISTITSDESDEAVDRPSSDERCDSSLSCRSNKSNASSKASDGSAAATKLKRPALLCKNLNLAHNLGSSDKPPNDVKQPQSRASSVRGAIGRSVTQTEPKPLIDHNCSSSPQPTASRKALTNTSTRQVLIEVDLSGKENGTLPIPKTTRPGKARVLPHATSLRSRRVPSSAGKTDPNLKVNRSEMAANSSTLSTASYRSSSNGQNPSRHTVDTTGLEQVVSRPQRTVSSRAAKQITRRIIENDDQVGFQSDGDVVADLLTRRIARIRVESDGDGDDDQDKDDGQAKPVSVQIRSETISSLELEASVKPLSRKIAGLQDLLHVVSQETPYSFDKVIQSFVKTNSMQQSQPNAKRKRLEKIGEASYSEVFKLFAPVPKQGTERGVDMAVKIIPLLMEHATSPSTNSRKDPNDEQEHQEMPEASPCQDVKREIQVLQTLGGQRQDGVSFVSLQEVYIVAGRYPQQLLDAWDRWDAKRMAKHGEGAENIRPSVLSDSQLYAILLMKDGGTDLESCKINSWLQAAATFWQVVHSLAFMEEKHEFEHRDLHWGNVLVQFGSPAVANKHTTNVSSIQLSSGQRLPSRSRSTRSTKISQGSHVNRPRTSSLKSGWKSCTWMSSLLETNVCGVKATIIDFNLSRIAIKNGRKKQIIAYPFDDECIFEGQGDTQFDVYRSMREHIQEDWEGSYPITNIMWLHYLIDKMVTCKGLTPPPSRFEDDETQTRLELKCYTSLMEANRWMKKSLQTIKKTSKQRRGRSLVKEDLDLEEEEEEGGIYSALQLFTKACMVDF